MDTFGKLWKKREITIQYQNDAERKKKTQTLAKSTEKEQKVQEKSTPKPK